MSESGAAEPQAGLDGAQRAGTGSEVTGSAVTVEPPHGSYRGDAVKLFYFNKRSENISSELRKKFLPRVF